MLASPSLSPSPSPSQWGQPGELPEEAAPPSTKKKKKRVSFAVRWPGERLDDWCDATRAALTPAAAVLVQAVFARFDADGDDALCASELNALNNGTGSGDLEKDDLDYLLGSFHATVGGMSARGLVEYYIYALKTDLADALKDLKSLGLHAA